MTDAIELATHVWPPLEGSTDDAPVAVLVHGITGWWKTWWRVGPALAVDGFRVIAVDQRAHGRSPSGEPCTVADLAADLEAAIERHADPPVDLLVGHSLGAAVSQWLAHRRPDIARRLILEDPPGVERREDIDFQERLRSEAEAARRDPEGEVRRELRENPRWLEEDARQNVEGRARCREQVIIDSLRLGRGFRVADLAAEIRIPTRYILAGEDGSVMTGEARRRLLANLPAHSDAVVLEGGHTLHRDRFDEYMAAIGAVNA